MSHIPKPGDVYIVAIEAETQGTMKDDLEPYNAGDRLILLEPTGLAPFGHQSSICNWLVECKHFKPPQDEAVWSNIWHMIEIGAIAWEGDEHECTRDGTNVCTQCGKYGGSGKFVCREYDEGSRVGERGRYLGPTCKTCGFNFVLHGWQK